MNAPPIIDTLRERGVTVYRIGDRIRLRAESGNLPADLLELARPFKAELLALLPDTDRQRDRLRTAAKAEWLPTDEIDRLTPKDVEGLDLWTDAQLRRVAHWYHRDPPRLWHSGAA